MSSIITSHYYSCTIFILLFIISSLCFNRCDARGFLDIFKRNTRITLSEYNTQIDSLDLPTIDAYDPRFSPYNYPSLIAPSPPLITLSPSPSPSPIPNPSPNKYPHISEPPVYGSNPSPPNPIPSPHYGPTSKPIGAPTHNPSPSSSVWCVARPTINDPLLQRAMDYACGAGADCGPVKPNGSCFVPNTLVAHSSYAFNSYWQRTKIVGGTCDFGGTAMLVNVDPSYDGCHFMYN